MVERGEDKFYYNETELYEALNECNEDFIVVGNLKTSTFKYPPKLVKLLGFETEIIHNPLEEWKKVILPEDWERFYNANMNIVTGKTTSHSVDFRVNCKDGKILGLRCSGKVIKDKNNIPSTFGGVISVYGKRNKVHELTNLLTIGEFPKGFAKKLKENPENLAMITLGIDNFAKLNEFCGKNIGDEVLKSFAEVIQEEVPYNIEVYKLEGDKFGVIIENTSKVDLENIYKRIKSSFTERQITRKRKVLLTISSGVAFYPKDSKNYQDLYYYSHYSLYRSKRTGKNKITFFSKEIFEAKERYLKLLYHLKESVIEKNFEGFSLVYQPQVDTNTQKLKGVEALLRWKNEELGNVSPMEFIPILEDNEMIISVGKWVLEKSLEDCKALIKKIPDMKVSVNISFKQIMDKEFLSSLKAIITKSNFPPTNIILELTESYMTKSIELMIRTYEELKKMGIQIALDDFGTGYSSLAILKEIPVDIVKIDRAFVRNILQSSFDATFVKFIVAICKDIDLKVCLEGVETEEEYNFVKPMGIDVIQGYYFGKPQRKEEIVENFILK